MRRWLVVILCLGIFATSCSSPPPKGSSRATTTTTRSSASNTNPSGGTTSQPEPAQPDIDFVDDIHGWASGAGGVLATINGGTSWHIVLSSSTGAGPLDFLTAQQGWVVDGGTLEMTLDGGAHWLSVGSPGALAGATQLDFLDSDHGWAVVTDSQCSSTAGCTDVGTLLKTADGGSTWTQVGAHGSVQVTCWATAQRGWTGDGTTVRASSDGGTTWSEVMVPLSSRDHIDQIACSGSTVWVAAVCGVAAGSQCYQVTRSLDNGEHWQLQFAGVSANPQPVPHVDDYLGPIDAPTPEAAFLVGACPNCALPPSQGTIAVTVVSPSGSPPRSYDVTPSTGPGGGPIAASFPDTLHGWIIASVQGMADGVIFATANGAQSWSEQIESATLRLPNV